MPGRAERVELGVSPVEAVRRWPIDRPLIALLSVGNHPRWSRWSILTSPVSSTPVMQGDEAALRRATQVGTRTVASGRVPFCGGTILSLRYEAGALFEPAAGAGAPGAIATVHTCPTALLHDNATGAWWEVGETGATNAIRDAADRDRSATFLRFSSTDSGERYAAKVRRALEYIRAGDVYQVNLAHALTATFDAPPRELFASVAERVAPWFGAYVDEGPPGHATLCWSPELLVSLDGATRELLTRPIKGTRRGEFGGSDLLASEKDGAELAMIVDLMRNDLGRVAEYGSVRVSRARDAERHAGTGERSLTHTVATVSGRLRESENAFSLLRAVYPAGSITGAPKVRAMQIIRELEARQRGAYCGSIGYISTCGNACFNVAIRTASVIATPSQERAPYGRAVGSLELPVGAGIVADSEPMAEWLETLAKADAIIAALEALGSEPS